MCYSLQPHSNYLLSKELLSQHLAPVWRLTVEFTAPFARSGRLISFAWQCFHTAYLVSLPATC